MDDDWPPQVMETVAAWVVVMDAEERRRWRSVWGIITHNEHPKRR